MDVQKRKNLVLNNLLIESIKPIKQNTKHRIFLLGKNQQEENFLFYEEDNTMVILILNNENQVVGTSLLITDNNIMEEYINKFCRMASILTNLDYQKQIEILEQCEINESNIKNTDSNFTITVGKYKYSVVSNNYSITLFCERV